MKETSTPFHTSPLTSRFSAVIPSGVSGVILMLMLFLPLFFSCRPLHYSERRAQLDSLQRANQADTVFRSDSLQRILVDYFDRHGTADDRMLAHYLLGRAYYDMGETPLALHHYHEAIESADATDKDCDFRQLGRIHGQAASMLLNQGDPKDASAEFDKAIRILKICDDTLGWIACLENKGSAYEYLNRLDSAVIIRKYASQQYSKYGCHSRAAIAMAPVIDILVEQKRMKEARQVIQEYESVGALFDKNHEIQKGREIYYYSKGLYYLGIAELDSAESCFRKLLSRAQKTSHLSGAYRGLEKLYREKGVKDSALHYSMLAYAYNDSCHREKNTENYQRAQAQYDYSRHQQAAAKASERARRLTWATACLCGALLLVLWAGVWLYRRVKASQRRRMADENRRYNDLLDRLAESEQTILRLEANASEQGEADQSMNDELEKERLVSAGLREELSVYEEDGNVQWSLKESLIETPAVVRLHELACHGKAASARAKGMLRKVVEDRQPSFYAHVMSPARKLTELEQTVSILIRLQFARSEISTLLDKSPQQVTNICSSINEKLFGRKGTKQLDSSLRQL